MSDNEIQINSIENVSIESNAEAVEVGQWYWVSDKEGRTVDDLWNAPDGKPKLMCVVHVGSNYIKLRSPEYQRGTCGCRVHFDNFWTDLQFEPNAESLIHANIQRIQGRVNRLLSHIQKVANRLGVNTKTSIGLKPETSDSTGLSVISSTDSVDKYKRDLVHVKEVTLPKLTKQLKSENEILVKWMSAQSVSVGATLEGVKATKKEIDSRVFNVSIYAGLSEHTHTVLEGEPAGIDEQVCLFQRMMFMDEESLLDYDVGGMEFSEIGRFDQWLARPNNFKRLLPFPKSVAAFRVRRHKKEREAYSIDQFLRNIQIGITDTFTFLYVRNGEQLHRVTLEDFEFGEKLFPDNAIFDPSEPMTANLKWYTGNSDRITLMPKREFDVLKAESEKARQARDQWFTDNPEAKWLAVENAKQSMPNNPKTTHHWRWANPVDVPSFNARDFAPFDKSSVYYDDILEKISSEIEKTNRVSLIMQGLFDRSEILSPHHPVKTWEPASFAKTIRPIYDASMALYWGEAPDINEYIQKCNDQINKDSVFYGQWDAWQHKEYLKECDRVNRSWRRHEHDVYRSFTPYGNDGPNTVDKPCKIMLKARKATFEWARERLSGGYGEMIRATGTYSFDVLFNVSAYQIGDYKQFFRDPRTRQNYLKWAPLLMAAEEYHQSLKMDE